MKSISLRNLFSGKSIQIIKDGTINQKMMKKLRFTTDDLLEALRQKDIFDLKEVDTAIVETNGVLSVLKSGEYSTPTLKELNITPEPKSVPEILISDGNPVLRHPDLLNDLFCRIGGSDSGHHNRKNDRCRLRDKAPGGKLTYLPL